MTVRIKADIETLMHLKAINILIIIISLLFTACAEDNNQNNIINDDSTKYDFVYNEPVVVYSVAGNYDTGNINKGIFIENITLSFNNMRNEEVYILIPESDENKADEVSFLLNNAESKCSPLAKCSINFNMLIKEQSQLNNSFTVYLPVTLLNQQEMNTFIEMNKEEKYKPFAMKYLNNRIYIKFKITGSIAQQ